MFTRVESAERADLALRREIKYAHSSADIDRLRGVLESHCERLVYAGVVSTVRSIYFDDVRLSSCLANIAGLGDPTGRVLGLMPHPERFLYATQHPQWTRRRLTGEGAGMKLFRNAVEYFA